MEEKAFRLNKGLMFQFSGTDYWKELRTYLEDKKNRESEKLFCKTLTNDSEILAAYHEAKSARDQAQGIINHIEIIRMEELKKQEEENKNGKKTV